VANPPYSGYRGLKLEDEARYVEAFEYLSQPRRTHGKVVVATGL
jgi:hypothetical protein